MILSRPFIVLAAFVALAGSAKANIVTNPNFAPGNPGYGYGPVAGWTSAPTGNTGYPYLTGSNSVGGTFFNNGTLPAGDTTAGFIQVYPGILSEDYLAQILTTTIGQTYNFSFLEDARMGTAAPYVTAALCTNTSCSTYDFMESGLVTSGAFQTVSGSFTASSSTEYLAFVVDQVNPNDDATALISNVNITAATPEPSSLILLGTGLVGIAGAAKRRFFKS